MKRGDRILMFTMFAALIGWNVYEHRANRPVAIPDKIEVAARAELTSHVSAWAEIAKRLAAKEIKPEDVPVELAKLKQPAATALATAIAAAGSEADAFAKVGTIQGGMLK